LQKDVSTLTVFPEMANSPQHDATDTRNARTQYQDATGTRLGWRVGGDGRRLVAGGGRRVVGGGGWWAMDGPQERRSHLKGRLQ